MTNDSITQIYLMLYYSENDCPSGPLHLDSKCDLCLDRNVWNDKESVDQIVY